MALLALASCAAVASVTQHAIAITLKNKYFPAHPEFKSFAALPDPGQMSEVVEFEKRRAMSPIMMFTHGCSCTTAGVHVIGDILRAHNIEPADTGHGELMKSLEYSGNEEELKHNMGAFGWKYGNEKLVERVLSSPNLVDKFKIVYQWTQNESTAMFFKNELAIAEEHDQVMQYLQHIDTKAFLYIRSNLMDVLACRVMDFCSSKENSELGQRVDANGKDLGCGFRGRGDKEETDVQMYVKFHPEHLLAKLKMQEEHDIKHQDYLEAHGYNGKIYSAENLLEFEYGEKDGFSRSVDLWSELLRSFGITPDPFAITEALQRFGTFPPPKKSSELIYNFNEVREALKGTKYYDMLRQ